MKNLAKFAILALFLTSFLQARVCTDMLGNQVEVPDKIERIFSLSPMGTALLYALAPEKVIAVNYKFYDDEKSFMLEYFKTLPVFGGLMGGGGEPNLENILSAKPDIIFSWDAVKKNSATIEKALDEFKIPLIYIKQDNLEDLAKAFEVAGSCLGEEERAKMLAQKANTNLELVKKSVTNLKMPLKKVYLANNVDGLKTECNDDIRSAVVGLAGGKNIYECAKKDGQRSQNISIEEIYAKDPDVILVRHKKFYEQIYSLPNWQQLRAVKDKQVYFVPVSPFSWVSRPPSFMRFLGVVWLHKILYPEHFDVNLNDEIKQFYTLFLQTNLSDDDITRLLNGD